MNGTPKRHQVGVSLREDSISRCFPPTPRTPIKKQSYIRFATSFRPTDVARLKRPFHRFQRALTPTYDRTVCAAGDVTTWIQRGAEAGPRQAAADTAPAFFPWAGIWKRCQMFTANCSEWRASDVVGRPPHGSDEVTLTKRKGSGSLEPKELRISGARIYSAASAGRVVDLHKPGQLGGIGIRLPRLQTGET
jgi:hypothetical protein